MRVYGFFYTLRNEISIFPVLPDRFAALFGQILSEIAVNGRTGYPIRDFTMDREAINDPNYVPVYKDKLSKPPADRQSKL